MSAPKAPPEPPAFGPPTWWRRQIQHGPPLITVAAGLVIAAVGSWPTGLIFILFAVLQWTELRRRRLVFHHGRQLGIQMATRSLNAAIAATAGPAAIIDGRLLAQNLNIENELAPEYNDWVARKPPSAQQMKDYQRDVTAFLAALDDEDRQ